MVERAHRVDHLVFWILHPVRALGGRGLAEELFLARPLRLLLDPKPDATFEAPVIRDFARGELLLPSSRSLLRTVSLRLELADVLGLLFGLLRRDKPAAVPNANSFFNSAQFNAFFPRFFKAGFDFCHSVTAWAAKSSSFMSALNSCGYGSVGG